MINIWGWLNEIQVNKGDWDNYSEEDKRNFQPYMIHRLLSMDYNLVEIVDEIQIYSNLDDKVIYNIYKYLLPKKKTWNKYLKSNSDKFNKELVDKLSEILEISKREAKEYYQILGLKETRKILDEYGASKETKRKQ